MASTAVIAADKTVNSNVIGINAGQLLKGPAADIHGIMNDRREPLHEEAADSSQQAADEHRSAGIRLR